ncbi:MAG: molybdopterin-dependent oxidoreductase, partial [Desulfobulbia bacterium]
EAFRDGVILAYEMNGQPLTPPFGYPLRLIVPHWYGMASVKWLGSIIVLDHEFHGYYMDKAYRIKSSEDESGIPITLQKVRSLIHPPGVRFRRCGQRLLKTGPIDLQGKAWAGRHSVIRVEISFDSGSTWHDTELKYNSQGFAWTSWTFPWIAEKGQFEIMSRATASDGSAQPLLAPWNYLGMENNSVQSLSVVVDQPD